MSRKIILSLAAVATLAGAVLTSNNADAVIRRVGGGGHSIVHPIRPIGYPGGHWDWRFHEHRHFVRWHCHIFVRPVGYVVRAVETGIVQPGPCAS